MTLGEEEDDDFNTTCSDEEEVFRDFDDDDDDATIGMIFNKLKSTKGKSAGSQSGTSQTETQHQESNQSKDKEVKEEEEEAIPDEPIHEHVLIAAAEAGLTPEEYIKTIKHNAEQLQRDFNLAKRVNRQIILQCRLRDDYVNRRIEDSMIISCACIQDAKNRIMINYRLSNHLRKTTYVDQLYTFGYVEWRCIARCIKGMADKKLKEIIMYEIILLVEAAHDLGKLNDREYGAFCVAYNIKKDKQPMGLRTMELPEGVTYIENTYIKQKHHEGFCYRDDKGNACFQSINSLNGTNYYHLLALLDLCKDRQSLPFRKRVVRCLFNHLSELDTIPELKSKCNRIRKEHNKYEKENLDQVELKEKSRMKRLED